MLLSLPLVLLLVHRLNAQSSTLTLLSGTKTATISDDGGDLVPTGAGITYLSDSSTITISSSYSIITSGSLSGSIEFYSTTMAASNTSMTYSGASPNTSSTSQSVSLLQGSVRSSSSSSSLNDTGVRNSTVSSTTSASAAPTNTQPCNDYPEFCSRRYSNITYVAAHNSPFVNPNNAAANQALGVIDQLNDGIRMLQGQTHVINDTVYYCHTSCDLLNAGTAESYFMNVTSWIKTHPYDVITILIGNGDLVNVGNFTSPIVSSGLVNYAYVPPKIPMGIDDWPTLSQLILTGKRAIIFMDYNANQTQVPYILDEFSQLWETPFSPTNRSFPCTQQRPPGLSVADAEKRMYMANHNLNTDISIAGTSILVPTSTLLNVTNNVTGFGSLGLMANNCVGMPPSHQPHPYFQQHLFHENPS